MKYNEIKTNLLIHIEEPAIVPGPDMNQGIKKN